MARRTLNLNALRAFESAGRNLSFTKAASELLVTHAAISHQVRQLEERLGTRLFERKHRGVALTEAGVALLPRLSDAFDRLEGAIEEISAYTSPRILKVSATPSFASRWLVPRLPSWHGLSKHSIDVHLLPTLQLLDLTKHEADIAIRCGIPPWPGLVCEPLLSVNLTPVCSPDLLPALGPTPSADTLLDQVLLHADVGTNPLGTEWRTWFAAAGVTPPRQLPGVSFNDPALSVQAAINGVGFAMAYIELVEADLAAGRLAQPVDLIVEHPYAYYLVYPPARRDEASLRAFRDWILAEAARPERPAAERLDRSVAERP